MKNIFYISCIALIFGACNNPISKKADASNDEIFVRKILNEMTLKEKIGQMTQLNLDVISQGAIYNLKEPHELDTAKMHKAIVEYGVGSILNVGGHAYSLAHFQNCVAQIQEMATQQTRLKIPVIYGIDAIHGANYLLDGTLFPQPLAQAATFNPELVEKAAAITAYETKASGIPWNFSPVLDVARQPLWSRVFETYGEDVLVCKEMGKAAIKGYQGEDPSHPEKLASCMKHFLGYSMPFSGRDRTTVFLHERQIREIFLPSFEEAIKAGSLSVMINSGDINGIAVHADKYLLTDVLRKELKFDGVAVTDWEDIMKLEYPHKIAANLKEAVAISINAGIDMSMVPNDYRFSDLLYELVEEGKVSTSRIDEAVFRILLMKKRLGLFENPIPQRTHQYPLVGSDSFQKASEAMALEAITLLKNKKQILPLSATQKIFVTGPMAHSLIGVNGAWSRTWQGTDERWNDSTKMTILDALKLENQHVSYVKGCELDQITELQKAKVAARNASVIIAVMGEKPSTEKVGDINTLEMDKAQLDYVKELATLGKPIILVLVQNRMRVINEIVPLCDGIILAYQPSENGTKALANIIFGNDNPSGKLPVTYPKYVNNLLLYDHKYTDWLDTKFAENAFDPQFEFGHGLSYSTFEYSPIQLKKDTFSLKETIEISVLVKNTSEREGKETVLLFVTDEVASITPSVKRLRGFDKKAIAAGNQESFIFTLTAKDLSFVGKDQKWITEPGDFTIQIGNQKRKIYLK